MNVHEREAGDVAELERLIEREPGARQRDRYRMALWAIRGMEAERIWRHMRSHHLSSRAYDDYDQIRRAAAYRALTPDLLRSVCRCECIERAS